MEATIVKDDIKHYPVLLNEIISVITPQHGGTFIDCTFGQGGYTKKILSYPETKVISLDRDIETQKIAEEIKLKFEDRFLYKNLRFSQISNLKLKNENFLGTSRIHGTGLLSSNRKLNKFERYLDSGQYQHCKL